MATKKGDDQAVLDRPAEQSLATVGSSDVAVFDYGNDYGAGSEDIAAHEVAIPFYRILQPLSPECQEGDPKYIPDAKPGMILNTATGRVFSGTDGLEFTACDRAYQYLEYVPRDAGGGFRGIWQPNDPRIARYRQQQGKFGKIRLESGNELIETKSLFGPFRYPDGTLSNGIVAFSSTQIPKYNQLITLWMEQASKLPRKPPLFAYSWILRTQKEKNAKGSYYGWRISFERQLQPNDPMYTAARDFYELIRTGQAQADYGADGGGGEHEGEIEQPF